MPVTVTSEMLTFIGGIIAAGLTYLGVRVTSKASTEAKRIEAQGPDWRGFTEEIRQSVAEQKERIAELEQKVDSLQKAVESIKRKYWAAVAGLRRVARESPTALATARLPPDVHEDVVNG